MVKSVFQAHVVEQWQVADLHRAKFKLLDFITSQPRPVGFCSQSFQWARYLLRLARARAGVFPSSLLVSISQSFW